MITSLDNKKIKEVVKLKQKKYRDKTNLFIAETPNIIEESINTGLLVSLFVKEGSKNVPQNTNYEIVTSIVMNKISSLENNNMLAVCKKKESTNILGTKILLLDNIQDPGNLGTIIRTALGFNIDTIVLSNTSVDLYNEKVIRATEGAIFKINIIRDDLANVISFLKQRNIPIYGTDVSDGVPLEKIEKKDSYAVVMGSEGRGVSPNIKKLVDKNIYIRTNKELESLNVGVATGIILYELDK